MSDWVHTYDGVFFITIATILFGFFGLAIKYCLKSKCEDFILCYGLVKIHRRVDLEVEEEMINIQNGITDENKTTDNI